MTVEPLYLCKTTNDNDKNCFSQASQYLQNLNVGQTEESVRELLKALTEFSVPFTYNEKLMIINTLPRTSLELSLVCLF